MKYTWGVELETSAGFVADSDCLELGIAKHGDRSIGSLEYVTGILHGDRGLSNLDKALNVIRRECYVDDRCSVHVHVGGLQNTPNVIMPGFDHIFSIYAIKLGCQLEDELFSINPPSRSPKSKYCHSISRYKEITPSNWKDFIGAFVFGDLESKMTMADIISGKYSIGPDRNHTIPLGRWCNGRYKWLNLVHLHSASKIKTIEFRIFSGSLSNIKVRAFVLTCLAYVWFVENRRMLIDSGGVTLDLMVKEAYLRYPDIKRELMIFYQKRKDKFKSYIRK
jgi:hypothetical protein